MNESNKYQPQALFNYWTDDDVKPPTLVAGQLVWDGSAWVRSGPGGMPSGSGVSALKRFIITASASGNTAVVAAVAGKKIRVISFNFVANGTVNVKWQSATTDISGLTYCVQFSGKALQFHPGGHLETAVAEALNINLSGNVAVGGEGTYIEV